jgi:hypothetical protein
MRWGDAEFEIEGVANKELKNKIDYLYETFKLAIQKTPKTTKEKLSIKRSKQGGGRKTPFYKSNIQRIIDEEPQWFVEKGVTDVVEKLKTQYGVPGAKDTPVGTALTRLFQKGLLTRKEDKGKYFYSVTTLKTA